VRIAALEADNPPSEKQIPATKANRKRMMKLQSRQAKNSRLAGIVHLIDPHCNEITDYSRRSNTWGSVAFARLRLASENPMLEHGRPHRVRIAAIDFTSAAG
jgi:hypothetical protein